MTSSDIETIIAAQVSLIEALDSGQVLAIEATTARLSGILASVRHGGAIADMDRGRVDHALRQAEAARSRVNYLADRTRRRADYLDRKRGGASASTYAANGQIRSKIF